eukprot:1159143-Pelagomonas_calceolata.AAC.2
METLFLNQTKCPTCIFPTYLCSNAQRESHWGRYNWAGAVSAGVGLGLGSASLLAQADAQQPPSPPGGSDQVSTDPYKRPTALQGLPKDITLYQYEVCPFCCKVKAALDYYKTLLTSQDNPCLQLPYEVIEVNPLTKSELKWSNYKKVRVLEINSTGLVHYCPAATWVPVVKMDGSVVVDSTVIMSRLAAEYEAAQSGNKSSKYGRLWAQRKPCRGKHKVVHTLSLLIVQPRLKRSKAPMSNEVEEEERWRRWVDERLVKVITANIYHVQKGVKYPWLGYRPILHRGCQLLNFQPVSVSLAAFQYAIADRTNWAWGVREAARVSGAVLMWQVGKKMPAKYGIEGDLREVLYQ